LVVQPSRMPQLATSRISLMSAESMKTFKLASPGFRGRRDAHRPAQNRLELLRPWLER
jgi:hypothetical protein